jgi:voltage-gated potassium channel
MTWLVEHRFQTLLVGEAILFLLYPLVHGYEHGWLAYRVLHTFAFLAAALVLFQGKQRRTAMLLGAPVLLAAWADSIAPMIWQGYADAAFHFFAAIFLGFTAGALLADIFRARSVSSRNIVAAIGAYVLLGVVFAHGYCLVESLAPGSFRGSDPVVAELADRTKRYFVLVYFSLSTLTTVSYGDILPGRDAVRGMAMLEAITGQFYLAVLIAELVSRRASAKSGDETKHA